MKMQKQHFLGTHSRTFDMLRSVRYQSSLLSRRSKQLLPTWRWNSSFNNFPPNIGLYDHNRERDSCGVGLVANLNKHNTRKVVEDANRMLVRMSHRGACGREENSGDGAGMMVALPHEYFQRVVETEMNFCLSSPGSYGTGIVFAPRSNEVLLGIKNIFADRLKEAGLRLIGWKEVDTDNSAIGKSALSTEPRMEQIFVENTHKLPAKAFDAELYRVRNLVEVAAAGHPVVQGDLYVCSLSCQTITYKGQLTPAQLMGYFRDLQQPDFTSHFAIVHSRFSTNTFPSWPRAQPNRMMCHNGEINTLRGNRNWMQSRAGSMRSPVLGVGDTDVWNDRDKHDALFAPVPLTAADSQTPNPTEQQQMEKTGGGFLQQATNTENLSDSGSFDKVLELLSKASPRSLPQCVMTMIPEAWQDNLSLSEARKAFYQYNACVMEPWDGPAMIAFTDGRYLGATLDRSGLRPSRYYVTHDDTVLLASEVGVVPDLPDSEVRIKSRLEPGKMFLIDFETGKIVSDGEIKEAVAAVHPYSAWLAEGMFTVQDWAASAAAAGCDLTADSDVPDAAFPAYIPSLHTATISDAAPDDALAPFSAAATKRKLSLFGYTVETLDMLMHLMGVGDKEALGSMGNDAALAVLSAHPRMLFDYFKQLFAQVTNPPIDPIREELVMSLQCPVGPEANLLEVGPTHCRRMLVPHPILTLQEMNAVMNTEFRDWHACTLDCTVPVAATAEEFRAALDQLCAQAEAAVLGKCDGGGYPSSGKATGSAYFSVQVLVLSDRAAGPDRLPIPSLLAVGAVHQHLLRTQLRPRVALFADCGDAREVHDFCILLGFGVDGICPYFAYEVLTHMHTTGAIAAREMNSCTDEELHRKYRQVAAKGILKVMAKMGISTLQSYKGAQVFEALGLANDVMQKCFTGTASRIQGASFVHLLHDLQTRHTEAYPALTEHVSALTNTGPFHLRHGGEAHLNTPEGMTALQQAATENSREQYERYVRLTDAQSRGVTLRGLLRFKHHGDTARVQLSEVEPAAEIVKRFNTGAMSLGSISQETHEALAIAMNRLGARSNTGEGGEDPRRFGDARRFAIKQVASGRFGVTSHYLANADQLQIKMAQGAKPGEGGELPGNKVTGYIAENRATTSGVGLIFPPPHHDIYSIEDLAQLIYDLNNANPVADVSVKLVSEVGVGVVAAGAAKAKADHLTISGGDGGTGVATWTGITGAGSPWELGLAEAHQTLVLNGLRSRVRLQTDGQLKTGRDVVIAAMLGAEEFGFATAPLIILDCIMMRKCHLNTQDPVLRKKFTGKPESVVNYFFLLAEEVREYLAALDVRSVEELVGRCDLLEVNPEALHGMSAALDLSALLVPAATLNGEVAMTKQVLQNHKLEEALDKELLELARPAFEEGASVVIERDISNLDRSIGTQLSYHISKTFGATGLPDGTIHLKLHGHGGQSLGFALARGVFLELEGDSNDYVGKALSGGKIVVYPHRDALSRDFVSQDNVIVGNVCLYGATAGQAFIRGRAGERFAVRNSGALAVVEGVGDHACEYMTGGRVVVLGETGRNFAAGMSGGIAYVYDPLDRFADRCNREMVSLERITDPAELGELGGYLQQHWQHTGSSLTENLLVKWPQAASKFVKVMPQDYKRVLEAETREKDGREAEERQAARAAAAAKEDEDVILPYV